MKRVISGLQGTGILKRLFGGARNNDEDNSTNEDNETIEAEYEVIDDE
jgi:hypothetical protein